MARGEELQYLADVLLRLAGVRAAAGQERAVADAIEETARPWIDESRRDSFGNLWLIRRSRREAGGPRVMLSAHMDEIAWLVRAVEKGGFLRLSPLGGVDAATYVGHEVVVVTEQGELLPGIVGTKPPHLTREEEYRRFPEPESLFVDLGLSEEEARRRVKVGDVVYPSVLPARIGEGRVTGKALDNRASVATMLWALRLLRGRDHQAEIFAVATVQEELGMRGARTAATAIAPDIAIAIDVGFGLQPGVDRWHGPGLKLGGGPAITAGPNLHPGLRQALLDTARRIRVETQEEVAPGSTGTDAWYIQVAGEGIPVALLSLPLRYMHSAVELAALSDLEETARLLAEFLAGVGPEWKRRRPGWVVGATATTPELPPLVAAGGSTAGAAEGRATAATGDGEGDLTLRDDLAGRLVQTLGALSELRGPSGDEAEVRQWLMERLPKDVDEVFVDTMGNLLVAKGLNRPGPRVMVDAHMDEVGLIVKGVDDDGFLRVGALGGIDPRVLPAQRVLVGSTGLLGVIGTKPVHLKKGEERSKAPELDDLYVDIGVAGRVEAEKLVRPGDTITFATRFQPVGNGLVKGKALDDRGGVALLLHLLAEEWEFPFFAAFTAQEETGLRGAQVAADQIRPDFGLALETTICADLPDVPGHGQATRLGGGPAVSFQDRASVADPALVALIQKVAARENIAWQWRRALGGGNDAGAIQQRAGGARTCTLSIPCRYLHTPASLLAVSDMVKTYQLARAFLRELPRFWAAAGR